MSKPIKFKQYFSFNTNYYIVNANKTIRSCWLKSISRNELSIDYAFVDDAGHVVSVSDLINTRSNSNIIIEDNFINLPNMSIKIFTSKAKAIYNMLANTPTHIRSTDKIQETELTLK